jgi:hypothetical protein
MKKYMMMKKVTKHSIIEPCAAYKMFESGSNVDPDLQKKI